MDNNIQFQDNQYVGVRTASASQPSFLVRVVYATGLATTEAAAMRVLLVAAIVAAVLAVAVAIFLQPHEQELKPVDININKGRTP